MGKTKRADYSSLWANDATLFLDGTLTIFIGVCHEDGILSEVQKLLRNYICYPRDG